MSATVEDAVDDDSVRMQPMLRLMTMHVEPDELFRMMLLPAVYCNHNQLLTHYTHACSLRLCYWPISKLLNCCCTCL